MHWHTRRHTRDREHGHTQTQTHWSGLVLETQARRGKRLPTVRTDARHAPVDVHAVMETLTPVLPVTGSQPTPGSPRPRRDPVTKHVHPDTRHTRRRVSGHTSAAHTTAQRRRTWAPAAFEIQIRAAFRGFATLRPAPRPPRRAPDALPPPAPSGNENSFQGRPGRGAGCAAASAGVPFVSGGVRGGRVPPAM